MPTRNGGTALTLHRTDLDGVAVVRPAGRLDLTTYRDLRDGLLRCAVGEPAAVVVRLADGFECATPAFLSVFATVWLRVSRWPGVPVLLVAETPGHRRALAAGVPAVPRFTSLNAALAAVERPPERARAETQLPGTPVSARLARRYVRAACESWHVTDLADHAMTVATELVENAVRHARSAPVLRLELREHRLTVAVRDENPDRPGERSRGRGLTIVSSLCRDWGSLPSPRRGKVVWAVVD